MLQRHETQADQEPVQAFAPMNAYAMGRTQRLASLYGLKCSQQGSGKRRFVLVRSASPLEVISMSDAL